MAGLRMAAGRTTGARGLISPSERRAEHGGRSVILITLQGHPLVRGFVLSLEGHGLAPVVPGFTSTGLPVSVTIGMEALVSGFDSGQRFDPGTLAMTVSIISLSAIAEPAIAGDSTRSMPANREGVQPRHPRAARKGWMSWPRCHGLSALITGRVGSGFWRALQSRSHRIA